MYLLHSCAIEHRPARRDRRQWMDVSFLQEVVHCTRFDAFCSYGGLSVCGFFRMASKILVFVTVNRVIN